MSIGPTLPPHLQQKMTESEDNSCNSSEDENIGPKLPQAPKTTHTSGLWKFPCIGGHRIINHDKLLPFSSNKRNTKESEG